LASSLESGKTYLTWIGASAPGFVGHELASCPIIVALPVVPPLSLLSLPYNMATLEPRAIDDAPPNIDHYLATTAALDAEIRSLTALKDTVEDPTLKTVFESVLVILALARVGFFA
jgi:hypothetical protein